MKRGSRLTTKTPIERKTRLSPVGKKKRAKAAARRVEKLAPNPAPARAAAVSAPAISERAWNILAPGARPATPPPQAKRGELVSAVLMEALHRMPCCHCGKRPVTADHFPSQGAMGLRNDLLCWPACGTGTIGCHGAAQRHMIPEIKLAEYVGHTIAAHLRAGRCSWPEVEAALRSVERLDLRRGIFAFVCKHLRAPVLGDKAG